MKQTLLDSLVLILCSFLACCSCHSTGEDDGFDDIPVARGVEFDHGHRLWTEILEPRVHLDGFDYADLARDTAPLREYLTLLRSVTAEEIRAWSENERFSFWINAYNASTVRKVLAHYPLESIRDLNGLLGLDSVFEDRFIPLGHLAPKLPDVISLNDIEHKILRVEFEDARLHAAINCASVSCPPLLDEAFVASRLDEQLSLQMRRFINDPKRNQIDPQADSLRLSKIFDWFKEDFERDAGSVRDYVARYLPADLEDFVRKANVRYLPYDWDLNEAR